VHVRVDADVLQALEGQDQHEVGRLPPDARQRQQLLHRARHAAAVPFDENAAGFLHVSRFVPIEADRVNEALDLPGRQFRHRPRRPRDAEQPRRRGGRHRIARLGREHRRDQHVERIFLAFFRNFFDRRQIEVVDGARERAHDRVHGSGRRFRHYFG